MGFSLTFEKKLCLTINLIKAKLMLTRCGLLGYFLLMHGRSLQAARRYYASQQLPQGCFVIEDPQLAAFSRSVVFFRDAAQIEKDKRYVQRHKTIQKYSLNVQWMSVFAFASSQLLPLFFKIPREKYVALGLLAVGGFISLPLALTVPIISGWWYRAAIRENEKTRGYLLRVTFKTNKDAENFCTNIGLSQEHHYREKLWKKEVFCVVDRDKTEGAFQWTTEQSEQNKLQISVYAALSYPDIHIDHKESSHQSNR